MPMKWNKEPEKKYAQHMTPNRTLLHFMVNPKSEILMWTSVVDSTKDYKSRLS